MTKPISWLLIYIIYKAKVIEKNAFHQACDCYFSPLVSFIKINYFVPITSALFDVIVFYLLHVS